MQTKTILFSVLICGLISCTNQPVEKPFEEVKVETASADSNTFTIVTIQDTTQNGESILKYKNGQVKMEGMIKDGKREGLWKSFYENGTQWSESFYVNGVKNGPTKTWYENGNKRYEGFYSNDAQSGQWKNWDEAGNLVPANYKGKK